MTKTEFIHKAAIAFASNNSLVKDNYTPEYCTTLICELSEQLADKVAEKAEFDLEFQTL